MTVSRVLLFVLLAASGCASERFDRQRETDSTNVRIPEMESWNVQFGISETGKTRVEFSAPYLVRYRQGDSTETILRTLKSKPGLVTARFFDDSGRQSATLSAQMMRYSDRTRRYEAIGKVFVRSTEGRTLQTRHLIWMETERKVRTTDYVKITTSSGHFQGYELIADETLDNFTIARPTGVVTIEEE